jgi:hypothetical protein
MKGKNKQGEMAIAWYDIEVACAEQSKFRCINFNQDLNKHQS